MPSARRRLLLGVTNKLRARAEKPLTWFSTAGDLSELLVHHPVELMRGERAGKATDGMSRRSFFERNISRMGSYRCDPDDESRARAAAMSWFAQARAAKSAWLSETSGHDSGNSSSS
jgi:hypothetical protein